MLTLIRNFLFFLILSGSFFHPSHSAQGTEETAKLTELYSKIVNFLKNNPNQSAIRFDPHIVANLKKTLENFHIVSKTAHNQGMAAMAKIASGIRFTDKDIEQIALLQSLNGGKPFEYKQKNDALLFQYEPPHLSGKKVDLVDVTIYSLFYSMLSEVEKVSTDPEDRKRQALISVMKKLRLVDMTFIDFDQAIQTKDKTHLKSLCTSFLHQS